MPGDLILDGYDDLALVGTLIWPLYVLNLQGVIPHAVMRIVLIYIHSCSNVRGSGTLIYINLLLNWQLESTTRSRVY